MYGQFEVKHVRLSFSVRTSVGVRTYAQDNMKTGKYNAQLKSGMNHFFYGITTIFMELPLLDK